MPQKKNPDVAELHPRQDGSALRQPHRAPHRDEGAAPHLQLRHAGGQGARSSTPSTRWRRCCAVVPPMLRHPDLPASSACARRRARTTPPPPTSPTIWSARACPSARRTRWWAAWCATARAGARAGERCRSTSCGRFSPLIGADVHAALTVEASLAARAVIGGTAPEAVKQALGAARRSSGPSRAGEASPARGASPSPSCSWRSSPAASAAARRARRWRRSAGCPPRPPGSPPPWRPTFRRGQLDHSAHARGRHAAARPRRRASCYRRVEAAGEPAQVRHGLVAARWSDGMRSPPSSSTRPAPAVVAGNTIQLGRSTGAASSARRYVYVATVIDIHRALQRALAARRPWSISPRRGRRRRSPPRGRAARRGSPGSRPPG